MTVSSMAGGEGGSRSAPCAAYSVTAAAMSSGSEATNHEDTGTHLAPQFEVIRAILLEGSPCCNHALDGSDEP